MGYTIGRNRIGQMRPKEYRGIFMDIPLAGGTKTLSIEFGSDGDLEIFQIFKAVDSDELLACVQMSFTHGGEAETVIHAIRTFDAEKEFAYLQKWEEELRYRAEKENETKANPEL